MDERVIWVDILERGELELMHWVSAFTARTQASSS